ncbi:MAG TPA: hypothetical protein VHF50_04085 [Solirubrobacterales bacterium]|nr:hypothetical protein [Solirubrobacterales bacterium]
MIIADNASPRSVSDTVDLVASQPIGISYVPGSARLRRGEDTYPLSDSIITWGASIGYETMNGSFPAGFDKAALVEVRVRIFAAEPAGSVPYAPITAAAVLMALIALPPTRRRLAQFGVWWWEKLRDPAVHNQVVAGLLLIGLTALIGVMIELVL